MKIGVMERWNGGKGALRKTSIKIQKSFRANRCFFAFQREIDWKSWNDGKVDEWNWYASDPNPDQNFARTVF